jgi:hypothetical protein
MVAASRGTNVPDPAANELPTPVNQTLLDPALCMAADVLDDLERVRMANENRVRQMTRSTEDKDGETRGFGYEPSHPDVAKLAEIVLNLKRLEHEATLELQRRLRKHPLGGWVKATKGVGEKQGARLLAAIGDPYINSAKDAPRTVSALWAYCGLHVLRDTDQSLDDTQGAAVGVAAKRRKGERANWSTKAKMRAHLVAQKCTETLGPECKASRNPAGPVWAIPGHLDKNCRGGHETTDPQGTDAVPAQDPQAQADQCGLDAHTRYVGLACGCSPYRVVYDQRRAHTALTRPEWTDGHSHNDALRVASKAILRDLWRAARDWHVTQEGDAA